MLVLSIFITLLIIFFIMLIESFIKWKKKNPLHNAVGVASIKEIEALINEGADLEAQDMFKQTPLHCAVNRGTNDNLQIVSMLINAGANIEARDQRGKIPADYAKSAEMIALFQK